MASLRSGLAASDVTVLRTPVFSSPRCSRLPTSKKRTVGPSRGAEITSSFESGNTWAMLPSPIDLYPLLEHSPKPAPRS